MRSINKDSADDQVDNDVVDDGGFATDNNPPTAPSFTEEKSKEGIDIRQALEILSSRTPHSHNDHDHAHGKSCCGGGADKPLPAALKNMGQTIDLFAPTTASSIDSSQAQSSSQTVSNNDAPIDPAERRQKIRDTLRNLPLVALLKMVLTAQEDRVRTYRLYDEALGKVFISNRLTDYPPGCVAATAAFSVLSDTVAAVRDELSNRVEMGAKNNDEKKGSATSTSASTSLSVIKAINDLQSSEREKLQLTAACHLEQIRANNLKESNNAGENDENGDGDRRELSLLNKGINDLRSRIETCRSTINDIIEDLRCALVELMEEEGGEQ